MLLQVIDLFDQLIGMGWMQVREGDSAKLATRYPICATQSSDVVIRTARAQMIFFISIPLGSDAFCKALKKQIITQFKCGNHTSCTEPKNSTRCSFSRGGEKKTRENQKRPNAFFWW